MVPASRPSREPGWNEREAGKRPEPDSLRLLPSGPDRVGERFVRRQTPALYIESGPPDCESAFLVKIWRIVVQRWAIPERRTELLETKVPVDSFEDGA